MRIFGGDVMKAGRKLGRNISIWLRQTIPKLGFQNRGHLHQRNSQSDNRFAKLRLRFAGRKRGDETEAYALG